MNATHTVQVYARSRSQIIYRNSDGIGIGQQKECVLILGAVPNKRSSHVFINEEAAVKFLQEKWAAIDLAQQTRLSRVLYKLFGMLPKVRIQIEDADERKILLPDDAISLPGASGNLVKF